MCTVCTRVCPTGAIRELPASDKIWAKIGTAYVIKHKCIAWEFSQECLVCDEVCPFDAVELKKVDGIDVPVPFVDESRCNGCGFCEFHCPVQASSAIVVGPMNALRLADGSYKREAARMGYSFTMEEHRPHEAEAIPERQSDGSFEGDLPPGFTP